jgi:hypothetical protein
MEICINITVIKYNCRDIGGACNKDAGDEKYLLTYLLTYSLHGAGYYLKS